VNAPPFTVTRAALYEQVWAQPMLQLAKQYRVSSNAVAKACRKANIPVPPRGYWAKLQHGKRVMKRPPLPPAPTNRSETVTIRPTSLPVGSDPVVDARALFEQNPENRIVVPEKLHRPHPLVQRVAAALATTKTIERGMRCSRSGGDTAVLDVRVTWGARGRALRILDSLVKALEARGFEVNEHGVRIEGQRIPLGLVEKESRAPHVPTKAELARKQQYSWERIPSWDYAPNGLLSIYADAYTWWRSDLRKRWSDGRSTQLEDMLNEVVIGLVAIGATLRQRAEEQRREEEARAEQQRLREERARQARMEKARRDNLLACTKAWSEAQQIRELIAEIERRAGSANDPGPVDIQTWLSWAGTVADELDPLTEGLASFLQNHEKVAEEAARTDPRPTFGFGYS
jgi:hypothetical protein